MAKKMKQQQAMGKANQANQANQQYGTEFGMEQADVQAPKAPKAKGKANKNQ